jgi:hypothetical protein
MVFTTNGNGLSYHRLFSIARGVYMVGYGEMLGGG